MLLILLFARNTAEIKCKHPRICRANRTVHGQRSTLDFCSFFGGASNQYGPYKKGIRQSSRQRGWDKNRKVMPWREGRKIFCFATKESVPFNEMGDAELLRPSPVFSSPIIPSLLRIRRTKYYLVLGEQWNTAAEFKTGNSNLIPFHFMN